MIFKPKSSNLFDVYNREAIGGIDVAFNIKVIETVEEYEIDEK